MTDEKKTVDVLGLNFQEDAMNSWVSSQALNEASRDLRENYQTIDNIKFFFYSIISGITSTYFLSVRNWIMVFIPLILLEISAIPRLKYLKFRRKELLESQNKIRNHCKRIGLKVPIGYKN